jgi:uncharacterized membrane protein
MPLASLSPAVLIHIFFAFNALVLGPIALWARKGSLVHRAAGRAWVAMMLGAALSSLTIRDFRLPNLAGYTPIHILTVVALLGITSGIVFIVRRNVRAHRRVMMRTYFFACVGAGLFALLPGRFLGQLLWHQALGLV